MSFTLRNNVTAITIREMQPGDRPAWAAMRHALWPKEAVQAYGSEIDAILKDKDAWGFAAEEAGKLVGFAELSIRKAANGCESQPVPFLEGIWVQPEWRRRGVGKLLITYIEAFLKALGFRELGSDSLIENQVSHDTHKAWGFSETERVVYFRKPL
ncbi:MAG: GNAT family N-acetyltransferase [Rhodomicrobium sp.]